MKTHSALFVEGLGLIKGTTAKLYLKEGARPRFYRSCQVPYAIREQVALEIERQVKLGILEPVQFSPWDTPVVPIRKKGYSKPRNDHRNLPIAKNRRHACITGRRGAVLQAGSLPRLSTGGSR